MDVTKVIRIYNDDFEVIERLKKIPPIPVKPFEGLTVIQYIDNFSLNRDFGIVIPIQRVFYVIYKYGMQGDSGLLLIEADFEHAALLIKYMNTVDNLVFPNQEVYNSMCNDLLFFANHFRLL